MKSAATSTLLTISLLFSPAAHAINFADGLTHDIAWIIGEPTRVDHNATGLFTEVNFLVGGGTQGNRVSGSWFNNCVS